MSERELVGISASAMSSKDALRQFAQLTGTVDEACTVLLYGPQDCILARLNKDGALEYATDHKWPDQEPIFELRAFCQSAELRWLHEASDSGTAIIVTESDGPLGNQLAAEGWKQIPPKGNLTRLPQQYLLWGTGTGDDVGQGWSLLAEPRIGPLDIPLDGIASNEHAYLTSIMYIESGEDGNARIVAERLTGFSGGQQ